MRPAPFNHPFTKSSAPSLDQPLVREIDLDFDDRAIVKLKRAQRGSVATKGELRTAAIGRAL